MIEISKHVFILPPHKPYFWLSLALNLYTALNEIAICGGSGVSSKFKTVFLQLYEYKNCIFQVI